MDWRCLECLRLFRIFHVFLKEPTIFHSVFWPMFDFASTYFLKFFHIFSTYFTDLQTFYTHLYFPDIPLILVIFSRYSTYLSHIFQIFQVFPHITLWGSNFFFFFLHFSGGFPWTWMPWPSPAGRPKPRPLCARRSWRSCCRVWRRSSLEVFRRGERWRRRGCLGLEMVVIFSGVSWEFWGGVSCVFWGDFRFWGDFNGIFAGICYFSPLQDVFFLCVWQLL